MSRNVKVRLLVFTGIAAALVFALALVMISNTKHSDKAAAKKFLKMHYTVSEVLADEQFPHTEDELQIAFKQYESLMSEKGYNNGIANRAIGETWLASIREQCRFTVNKISFPDTNLYGDETQYAYSSYLVELAVDYVDGRSKAISVSGKIHMLLQDGIWLVNSLEPTRGELLEKLKD